MVGKPRIAVIGAGAFGGWTALFLLRRGAQVVLLDSWGPGNSRASSGGETRVLRCTYGPNQPYSRMAARAMRLWKEHEERWGRQLVHRTGVLWMARAVNDEFERGSLHCLREASVAYEELSVGEITKRWPQINIEGVGWGIYEPDGGYLLARLACQTVLDGFRAEGGEYKQSAVLPFDLERGVKDGLSLADGSKLAADQYVFAVGPGWENSFRTRSATRFARQSRMCSSSARRREMPGSRKKISPRGRTMAIGLFMEFREIKGEGSK